MLGKKVKSDVIEAYFKLFEDYAKTSDVERVYEDTVAQMQRIDLKGITKQDVEDIIKPFLIEWRMGRVLGRREYKGWEKKLKDLIREYSSTLDNFRKESLLRVDVAQFEKEIKEIYGKFKEALGPTAAGKTLNILCPNFFPLWDSTIREAFSQAFDLRDDYYMFMLKVTDFLKKYEETFSKLATKYNKSMVRIFDEFSWQITHNPIFLFSKRRHKAKHNNCSQILC